jgi:uncharacterized membrane protein
MNIEILFQQELPIPQHALMAIGAIVCGGLQLALPKGTKLHRYLGYLWVILLAGTAISALFIHTIKMWFGLFSPIHLLVPLTLIGLWVGVRSAIKGDIKRHKRDMVSLYIFALLITGGFTFLPGRVMHQVIFGG